MIETTVVTASLPSRTAMLAEACASVAAQTVQPQAHLIGVDYHREGSAAVRNRLAFAADTPWISFLDDDDLLYPNHLQMHSVSGVDLVYSWCDVEGRDWNPNRLFSERALRQGNFIPVTVSVRADMLRAVGGFRPSHECLHGWEDWDLWLRLLNAGGVFRCVPVFTWRYRFHEGNKTNLGEGMAA